MEKFNINDEIVAKRKVKSNIYFNMVIGPISEVYPNAINVICNKETDIETSFRLYFSDWDIKKIAK